MDATGVLVDGVLGSAFGAMHAGGHSPVDVHLPSDVDAALAGK